MDIFINLVKQNEYPHTNAECTTSDIKAELLQLLTNIVLHKPNSANKFDVVPKD
jgi:hypothetical protein